MSHDKPGKNTHYKNEGTVKPGRVVSERHRPLPPSTVQLGVHSNIAHNVVLSYRDPELMNNHEIAMELVSYGARKNLISQLTKLHPDVVYRMYRKTFRRSPPQGRMKKTASGCMVSIEARRQASIIAVYYHNILRYNKNTHGDKNSRAFHQFSQHLIRVYRRYVCNERNPIFSINDVLTIMRDMEVENATLRICSDHSEPLYYLFYTERKRSLCPYCQQNGDGIDTKMKNTRNASVTKGGRAIKVPSVRATHAPRVPQILKAARKRA